MPCLEYCIDARRTLLGIARAAIEFGLKRSGEIDVGAVVDFDRLLPQLVEPRATFITLRKFEALRGCTGSLKPTRPLVEDIADNACKTAFSDPRFPSLSFHELDDVRIEISVLSPLRAMQVSSDEDLIRQLGPCMGLVVEAAHRRGTFLPKVWERWPDPRRFLAELKSKAGIAEKHWSSEMRVFRFHTETFAESA